MLEFEPNQLGFYRKTFSKSWVTLTSCLPSVYCGPRRLVWGERMVRVPEPEVAKCPAPGLYMLLYSVISDN